MMISVDAWDGNPLLQFARNYLWYPGKNRSPMETPLTKDSINLLKTTSSNTNCGILNS